MQIPQARGLIVVGGAPLSHPMLHLLTLDIPSILIAPEQLEQIPDGTEFIIDGSRGLLYPPAESLGEEPLGQLHGAPGQVYRTADGLPVELRASIENAAEAADAAARGATSIGLVRSEYLIPSGTGRPTAEFYEQAFRAICTAAAGMRVNFRLLDIAPDKQPVWLARTPASDRLLGLQGVRLYSTEPVRTVVRDQALALSRVGRDANLAVLLPFVTTAEEYLALRHELLASLPPAAVAPMLETPSGLFDIAAWLERAEFVSVGCNDLMECFFGTDRDNDAVAHFLDPYAPVLLRFLRHVARAAGADSRRIQLCGLLPKQPRILTVLVGLGYRTFSVEPHLIPYLAKSLELVNVEGDRELVDAVCNARDSAEVRTLLGLTERPHLQAA